MLISATQSIDDKVQVIAQQEKRSNLNFFQIMSFANMDTPMRYPILDTIFLVQLEKNFNLKLAQVAVNNDNNLRQINSTEYIFVICFEFKSLYNRDCSTEFLKEYPNYQLLEIIFNKYPLNIYLAKNI